MEKKLYRQMRDLEDRHWWFLGRRHIVRSIIERLGLSQDITILDVGCGTGGNLSMLAKFGSVVGSEYDPEAARMAAERGVAEIVQSGLPDQMPFADGQFQLITLLDVLEHIDEDQASLETLTNLLSPGGHLVMTVPAFQFLWGAHDIEHHHRRRYRAKQLRQRLESGGLQVQWLSYYNSLLFPIVALVRVLRRVVLARSHDSIEGRELVLPPPAINWLLERLFASEGYWLGRRYVPFGVSLIAIARKP